MLCDCLNPKKNTLYNIHMIKTQVIFNKNILKFIAKTEQRMGIMLVWHKSRLQFEI